MKSGPIKKLLNIFALVFLLFLIYQGIVIWPLISPYDNFLYHEKYRIFNIYSDHEIDDTYQDLFDDVNNRLNDISIFMPGYRFDVFLCHNLGLYKTFADMVNINANSQGFNVQILKYTFISVPFIETTRASYSMQNKYNILAGNTAHIITHEIIHELIDNRIGILKSRLLPQWKKEGFCEYAASAAASKSDSTYSLKKIAGNYFSGVYDNIPTGRKKYIRAKLLVEYLINIKNLNFDKLMKFEVDEPVLQKEIEDWLTE